MVALALELPVFSAAAALGAATAAIVVVLVQGPQTAPVLAQTVIPLHAAAGSAASGQATARHTQYGWSIHLTVNHLPPLGPGQFYECWYAGPGNRPGHPKLITAGTFKVGPSGTASVNMWSAVNLKTRGSGSGRARSPTRAPRVTRDDLRTPLRVISTGSDQRLSEG